MAGDYQIQVLATGGDTDYTLSLKIDELTGMTPEEAIADEITPVAQNDLTERTDTSTSIADTTNTPNEITGEPVPIASVEDDISNIDGAIATQEENLESQTTMMIQNFSRLSIQLASIWLGVRLHYCR